MSPRLTTIDNGNKVLRKLLRVVLSHGDVLPGRDETLQIKCPRNLHYARAR